MKTAGLKSLGRRSLMLIRVLWRLEVLGILGGQGVEAQGLSLGDATFSLK